MLVLGGGGGARRVQVRYTAGDHYGPFGGPFPGGNPNAMEYEAGRRGQMMCLLMSILLLWESTGHRMAAQQGVARQRQRAQLAAMQAASLDEPTGALGHIDNMGGATISGLRPRVRTECSAPVALHSLRLKGRT